MKQIIFYILLCGCYTENPCRATNYIDMFDYTVAPTRTTQSGIMVDDSGHNIDLELVDQIVDEVEDCLNRTLPGGDLTEIVYSGGCGSLSFDPLYRKGLTIKIPGQYVMSCPGDSQQQLLLDLAPEEGCTAKGLTPVPDCACRWRCGVQDGCTAVTTPSLYMLKDPLIKIITGCTNVWYTPELAECASPSVPMMPE